MRRCRHCGKVIYNKRKYVIVDVEGEFHMRCVDRWLSKDMWEKFIG